MIEILDQSTESCLVTYFSGKVTSQEYQKFLDVLSQDLEASEKVSLVLGLSGFVYGDFETVKKDFKFGFGDYKKIHRLAFVGDQKWIEWYIRLMGPFTQAEEKHFPEGQIEAAFTWASS
jgi:hypothetical protein